MNGRRTPRRLPAGKRRELEIAAAIAREAVHHHHVESALRLIELGAERVSVIRLLSIYVRLHGLRGAQAEQLAYSVLAALGSRTSGAELTPLLGDDDLSDVESQSLFKVVRNRLRGRVHHDLRRWVELATGEAQMALLDIHARHAHRFADELAETHSITQACALYAELASVPDSLRTALAVMLLDRLAVKELPRRPAPQAVPRNGVPLHPRSHTRPRRVV